MCIRNNDLPFLSRQISNVNFAIHTFARLGAAKDVSTRVARIVQDAQHIIMADLSPDQFALMRTTADTAWNRRVEEWHGSSYRRARDWWVEHIPEQMQHAKMVIVESTSKIGIVYSDRTFEEVDRFLVETGR